MEAEVEIALINIVDGLDGGHLHRRDFDTFAQAFRSGWTPLLTKAEAWDLLTTCAFGTFDQPFRHIAGWFTPTGRYGTLKALSGLKWLMTRLARQADAGYCTLTADERSLIDAAVAGLATDDQCRLIARMLNDQGAAAELDLGSPRGIFWITDRQAAAHAVSASLKPGAKRRSRLDPSRLRNLLGLIHIDKEPLFAFRSYAPAPRVMRPTGFNGADNQRFCQDDARLGVASAPWGITTDLKGENLFSAGLSEAVMEQQRISKCVSCTYYGRADSSPPGTNEGYRDYLLNPRTMPAILARYGL